MPKYLLQIIEAEEVYAEMSPEESQQVMEMHNDFSRAVVASGASILGGEALLPTATAKYLRSTRTDAVTLVDNPAPELKEVLGGYYLIETADEDQAVELAKLCPCGTGYVEVRPIWEFDAGA